MRRALRLVSVLAVAVAPAAAQSGSTLIFEFGHPTFDDTAYAALSGGTSKVRVRAWDNAGVGLGAFTIRIYYDPAVATFVVGSARSSCPDSLLYPLFSPGVGPNFVEFSAAGCTPPGTGYTDHDVVTFALLLTGAGGGSALYVDPLAVSQNDGTPRPMDEEAAFSELCRGTTVWGDVDGDVKVGSRDALVALADAVGLPTSGFNLARGDVDRDRRVTSRDALYMLSHAVGLPTPGSRTAEAIAEFCAPQALLADTLYYQTEGQGRATPGEDGLTIRSPNDTAFTITADSSVSWFLGYKWRPRVSPADGSVLIVCFFNTSQPQICKRQPDGIVVRLTDALSGVHQSPAWSPAGDSVMYVRDGQAFIMDSAGLGETVVSGLPSFLNSLAWNPLPASSAVVAYTQQGCNGVVATRDRATGVGATIAQGNCGSLGQPDLVDWSPAGDSLVFDMYINNRKAVIVAPNQASAPLTKRVSASFHVQEAFWRPEGILFQLQGTLYGQLYLRRNDGTVLRVVRAAKDLHFPGMSKQ